MATINVPYTGTAQSSLYPQAKLTYLTLLTWKQVLLILESRGVKVEEKPTVNRRLVISSPGHSVTEVDRYPAKSADGSKALYQLADFQVPRAGALP